MTKESAELGAEGANDEQQLPYSLKQRPGGNPDRWISQLLGAAKHNEEKQDSTKLKMLNKISTVISPLISAIVSEISKTRKGSRDVTLFDFSQLTYKAFAIKPENFNDIGYGIDLNSKDYLHDTFEVIKSHNDNEERLVPIHTDGDGHCLVHSCSRAIIGTQILWHPLRKMLKQHFQDNLSKYKSHFQDFIEEREWQLIIEECDPDFIPIGGEPTGLRNIHILGLANVLKRPIILLDSMEGIQSAGEYSGVFLPFFSLATALVNRDGILNSPICIAWSSPAHRHFIPLVGIKGKNSPVLPRQLILNTWGFNDVTVDDFLKFDENDCCQIGGDIDEQNEDIQQLFFSHLQEFFQLYGMPPVLLAHFYHHILNPNGISLNFDELLHKAKTSIEKGLLYRCKSCHGLCLGDAISSDLFHAGGMFYEIAVRATGKLQDKRHYKFQKHDVVAVYDEMYDRLVNVKGSQKPLNCPHCIEIRPRQFGPLYRWTRSNTYNLDLESSTSDQLIYDMALENKHLGDFALQTSTALCIGCNKRGNTATFLHEENIGHQVCCYDCSIVIFNSGCKCPVCQQPITRIVKNYFL